MIIIDEMSLISSDMFYKLDAKLKEIFHEKKKTPFDLDAALGGETQNEEPSADKTASNADTDSVSTPASQESEPVAETKPAKKEKAATDNCKYYNHVCQRTICINFTCTGKYLKVAT